MQVKLGLNVKVGVSEGAVAAGGGGGDGDGSRERCASAAQVPRLGEALPRARARYAVAPVLLATRIFYTPHIIDIVVMFCYDAKKNQV